ncbi:hypothetical protein FA13DRAFT_378889 [Coprinellus micaceus]|uniref:Uncharacterized protein n=1 Tax=Coprinellus micaceus TaxID=71717 RepID=A0A4Y7SCY6_COPMI|nr:hypothetical protein FA13DRAFT_378889 [Coprinellus micaceus]
MNLPSFTPHLIYSTLFSLTATWGNAAASGSKRPLAFNENIDLQNRVTSEWPQKPPSSFRRSREAYFSLSPWLYDNSFVLPHKFHLPADRDRMVSVVNPSKRLHSPVSTPSYLKLMTSRQAVRNKVRTSLSFYHFELSNREPPQWS